MAVQLDLKERWAWHLGQSAALAYVRYHVAMLGAAARRIGMRRALSMILIVQLVGLAAFVLVTIPWFQDPTQIGTDVSNYLAAGLRLNAGHDLYGLVSGDRPVPLVPPFWTYPLLSPPPIAVLWRPLAILPPVPVMLAWWIGGLIASSCAAVYLIRRASPAGLAIACLLAPAIVLTALSSNAAAYLVPALLVVGVAHRHPRAAGVAVAIAAAVKLAPALLIVYLLGRGAYGAVRWAVAAGGTIAVLSVLGAGLSNNLAYLTVIQVTTAAGASPHAPAQGLLTSAAAEIALMAAGGALALLLRRWPRLSLGITAVTLTVATPAFYFETLALLLVAAAPIETLPARQQSGQTQAALARGSRVLRRLPGLSQISRRQEV